MTTTEINALLALRKKTHTTIAKSIGEERSAVSQVLNYLRENPPLREKIAQHLGMPVEELFDPLIPIPSRRGKRRRRQLVTQ